MSPPPFSSCFTEMLTTLSTTRSATSAIVPSVGVVGVACALGLPERSAEAEPVVAGAGGVGDGDGDGLGFGVGFGFGVGDGFGFGVGGVGVGDPLFSAADPPSVFTGGSGPEPNGFPFGGGAGAFGSSSGA